MKSMSASTATSSTMSTVTHSSCAVYLQSFESADKDWHIGDNFVSSMRQVNSGQDRFELPVWDVKEYVLVTLRNFLRRQLDMRLSVNEECIEEVIKCINIVTKNPPEQLKYALMKSVENKSLTRILEKLRDDTRAVSPRRILQLALEQQSKKISDLEITPNFIRESMQQNKNLLTALGSNSTILFGVHPELRDLVTAYNSAKLKLVECQQQLQKNQRETAKVLDLEAGNRSAVARKEELDSTILIVRMQYEELLPILKSKITEINSAYETLRAECKLELSSISVETSHEIKNLTSRLSSDLKAINAHLQSLGSASQQTDTSDEANSKRQQTGQLGSVIDLLETFSGSSIISDLITAMESQAKLTQQLALMPEQKIKTTAEIGAEFEKLELEVLSILERQAQIEQKVLQARTELLKAISTADLKLKSELSACNAKVHSNQRYHLALQSELDKITAHEREIERRKPGFYVHADAAHFPVPIKEYKDIVRSEKYWNAVL